MYLAQLAGAEQRTKLVARNRPLDAAMAAAAEGGRARRSGKSEANPLPTSWKIWMPRSRPTMSNGPSDSAAHPVTPATVSASWAADDIST